MPNGRLILPALAAAAALVAATRLPAAEPEAFLARLHHHTTLASTVPDNGDQNPYAIAIATGLGRKNPEKRRSRR